MSKREIMDLLENCPDVAHAVIADMIEKLGGSFVWKEEDANRMEQSDATVMMVMDEAEETVTFTIERAAHSPIEERSDEVSPHDGGQHDTEN